ncbi:hypothetical protein KOXY103107_16460 [Komagataeibacter xylinus]
MVPNPTDPQASTAPWGSTRMNTCPNGMGGALAGTGGTGAYCRASTKPNSVSPAESAPTSVSPP